MLSFKSFLAEDIASSVLPKAVFLITKYLKKKTTFGIFSTGIEEYSSARGKGYGVRFYIPKKNYSVRFNWKTASQVGFSNLNSVTFWNGKDETPWVITYDSPVSLIKVLPFIANVISTGKVPKDDIWTLPDDVAINESYDVLSEAVSYGMPEIFDGVLNLIPLPGFTKGKIHGLYKGAGVKIFDELERRYPALITKEGTKYVWAGKQKDITAISKQKADVLKAIGAEEATVSRGSGDEEYRVDPTVKKLEDEQERISFELQLEDLAKLVKLTIGGGSNALFVAGKGGVGKTHTTEEVLAKMGLRDGKGYFKNTGSASAAGIYALLFKYHNDIIFFDDSDDALGDTEARNIFKAATDTKPIRKLVWNKRGSNIADPEEMTRDEIIDAGMLPQYFNFTGKVIFISNLPLQKLDPDGALRTRAYVINIDPTDMEIYDFMDKIVDKMPINAGLTLDLKSRKHVVELLRKTTSKQAPSLRKLSRGLNMAAAALAEGEALGDDELARMIKAYA